MEINTRNKKAFTLIELITTIVVVAIVVIPSSIFLAESTTAAFRSEDITVALNLARMELEKTNNVLYQNIPIGTVNYAGASKAEYQPYRYDLRRTVSYIAGTGSSAESVKEIRVQVYPAGRIGSAQDLLTTVITHRARNVN